MSFDLVSVRAIDTHVHVEADGNGNHSLDDVLLAAASKYFKPTVNSTPTVDDIAQYYRERNLVAVVFTVDAHTATGHKALSSEDIVAQAGAHADVLIPFCSVDHTMARVLSADCTISSPPEHAG
jgi:predicted TIM-barrel fold metal-dependent hydrolase